MRKGIVAIIGLGVMAIFFTPNENICERSHIFINDTEYYGDVVDTIYPASELGHTNHYETTYGGYDEYGNWVEYSEMEITTPGEQFIFDPLYQGLITPDGSIKVYDGEMEEEKKTPVIPEVAYPEYVESLKGKTEPNVSFKGDDENVPDKEEINNDEEELDNEEIINNDDEEVKEEETEEEEKNNREEETEEVVNELIVEKEKAFVRIYYSIKDIVCAEDIMIEAMKSMNSSDEMYMYFSYEEDNILKENEEKNWEFGSEEMLELIDKDTHKISLEVNNTKSSFAENGVYKIGANNICSFVLNDNTEEIINDNDYMYVHMISKDKKIYICKLHLEKVRTFELY